MVSDKGGMSSGMDEMVEALSMGVGWRALHAMALREVEVDNAVTLRFSIFLIPSDSSSS